MRANTDTLQRKACHLPRLRQNVRTPFCCREGFSKPSCGCREVREFQWSYIARVDIDRRERKVCRINCLCFEGIPNGRKRGGKRYGQLTIKQACGGQLKVNRALLPQQHLGPPFHTPPLSLGFSLFRQHGALPPPFSMTIFFL